jgi:hypothetical protein
MGLNIKEVEKLTTMFQGRNSGNVGSSVLPCIESSQLTDECM